MGCGLEESFCLKCVVLFSLSVFYVVFLPQFFFSRILADFGALLHFFPKHRVRCFFGSLVRFCLFAKRVVCRGREVSKYGTRSIDC